MKKLVFCGIELASEKKKPTAISCIDEHGDVLKEEILFLNQEIIDFVNRNNPRVIAINAPLSLQKYVDGNIRMKKRCKNFHSFDPTLQLAARGIELVEKLVKFTIIEVCSSLSKEILGIKKETGKIKKCIENAEIAAITAKMFYEGKCRLVSGRLYIPIKENKQILL